MNAPGGLFGGPDSLLEPLDAYGRQDEVVAAAGRSLVLQSFCLSEVSLRAYADSRGGAGVPMYFKRSQQVFDQYMFGFICRGLAKGGSCMAG